MKVLLLLAFWAWPGAVTAPTRLKLPAQPLVQGRQVLLLGESHRSLGGVRALAASLPELKQAGVAAVGIEGLKLPHQAAVDSFVFGRAELPEESLSFSPQRRNAFRELLLKARETGTRLVALGRPLEEWGAQVAELAGTEPVSLAEQVQQAGEFYKPGFNEAVAEVALRRRNQFMAERLRSEMSPSAKAVVLVGHAHIARPPPLDYTHLNIDVSKYGHLGRELLERGLSAYSLTLLGGLFVTPVDANNHYWLLRDAYDLDDGDITPDAGVHHLSSPARLGRASEPVLQ